MPPRPPEELLCWGFEEEAGVERFDGSTFESTFCTILGSPVMGWCFEGASIGAAWMDWLNERDFDFDSVLCASWNMLGVALFKWAAELADVTEAFEPAACIDCDRKLGFDPVVWTLLVIWAVYAEGPVGEPTWLIDSVFRGKGVSLLAIGWVDNPVLSGLSQAGVCAFNSAGRCFGMENLTFDEQGSGYIWANLHTWKKKKKRKRERERGRDTSG